MYYIGRGYLYHSFVQALFYRSPGLIITAREVGGVTVCFTKLKNGAVMSMQSNPSINMLYLDNYGFSIRFPLPMCVLVMGVGFCNQLNAIYIYVFFFVLVIVIADRGS